MSRARSFTVPPADAAPVFAALGDETRLRMVARLSEHGAMSITRLTAGTDILHLADIRSATPAQSSSPVSTGRTMSVRGSMARKLNAMPNSSANRNCGPP